MKKSKMLLKGAVAIAFCLGSLKGWAQTQTVLTLTEVLDVVRKYHPIAQRASLGVDSAEANRLSARGAFDPAIGLYNAQKTFDGKNYYNYSAAELKIPTWYGIEMKAGLENNTGSRLDPQLTTGRSSYAGVSVPVLKNLLLDKRRAALAQANILVQQSEAERKNVFNNLLFDAAKTYWDWVREYQVYIIIKNTVAINQARFALVRSAYYGGDRAAIDTTEALAQLQNFMYLESDAFLRWTNTGLELSNFLWLDDAQPYNLPPTVVPDTTWRQQPIATYPVPMLEDALQTAMQQHPKLQSLDFKADMLVVDRRLKAQNLLPKLNMNYNFLQKGYEPWKGVGNNFFENNYKYGFEFGVPLLLREGRGELKMAKIKLTKTPCSETKPNWKFKTK